MKSIGIETPRSGIAHTMQDAYAVQKDIGFPCIIRPSFTLAAQEEVLLTIPKNLKKSVKRV